MIIADLHPKCKHCFWGSLEAWTRPLFREDAKGAGDPAGTVPAVHPPLHDLREDWKFGGLEAWKFGQGFAGRPVRGAPVSRESPEPPVRRRGVCGEGAFAKPLGFWCETLRVLGQTLKGFGKRCGLIWNGPLGGPFWRLGWRLFSAKTRRDARAWALHRSALWASLPCPSLAFLAACGCVPNLPVGREGAGGRRGSSPPDRPHPLRLRGNWGASQASKPPNFQASSPASRVR